MYKIYAVGFLNTTVIVDTKKSALKESTQIKNRTHCDDFLEIATNIVIEKISRICIPG